MNGWLSIYNDIHPDKVKYLRDIQKWSFNRDWNISDDDFFDILRLVWSNWEELEPMESGISLRVRDIKLKHDVDIVTSVLKPYIPYVKSWLEKNNIPYDNIVHSDDKLSLSYDLYIDDRPQLFIDMIKSYPKKKGIIYHQPWNVNVGEYSPLQIGRAYTWDDVVDLVRVFE